MIRTYGTVRILGDNYESLVPKQSLKISYRDKVSGIRAVSLETGTTWISSIKSDYAICPICRSNISREQHFSQGTYHIYVQHRI